jgi:5'-3' exonuclease
MGDFGLGDALHPFEQLLTCLSLASSAIVPQFCSQKLMAEQTLPTDLKVDMN